MLQRMVIPFAIAGIVAIAIPIDYAGANGDGGSSGGSSSGRIIPGAASKCGLGKVWDKEEKKCVAAICERGTVWVEKEKLCTPQCKRGRAWSKKRKKCLRVKVFNSTDEERYVVARAKAYGGDYRDAIALLEPISHTNDPRVLNFLGYSNRKLGMFDTALAYYRRALEINPDYTLARSYLGEGYLQIGRADLAQIELAEIAERCGKSCSEFRFLETEIHRYFLAKV